MGFDLTLFNALHAYAGQSRIADWIIIFFAEYAQYPVIVAFFILLYVSHYSRQRKIQLLWVSFASVFLSRAIITEIIRLFYHRERPLFDMNVHALFSEYSWSFPSGHAAFFFAFAAAIYFYNKAWGVWFFVAALLISMSRVVGGVHYPVDVLGGAVVGIVSASVVFFVIKKVSGEKR
ncbi:MAG: hypothetical protein COU47_03285 [Candidatus Niyogibacteria bacterium CG10_big_fil_rev_8_21_14_0_10_46_36]|uniref:Phosphatidic acid phosphatase type 2/haloperoxidase domain-containing protein n=1 Tax=Candidatus Niyogibacteria bacterium CG10_big_fil_rev_8_21_14_0_10_46_36 TaxID=1974726 RepID=A0A2H0TCV6_9BACT|nr:MAG: hypothetical protein COU47_03285 [Candidatus Niyogibacteria bacterium CG10_big_fil_rev_8_21_14_0_10_46_36]